MKTGQNQTQCTEPKRPIREMQNYLRLISAHYTDIPELKPDGIFGPETTQAVKVFQEDFGLPVTGVVDFQTWTRIYQVYLTLLHQEKPAHHMPAFPLPGEKLQQGDTGSYVALMQVMINSISNRIDNISGVSNIGKYDRETAESVRKIQSFSRLPESGEIDADTWNAIMYLYYTILQ